MVRILPLLVLPLLVACAPSSAAALRLESFSATTPGNDGSSVTWSAPATAEGSERDWLITLDEVDGSTVPLTVHTPGASDLALLDGGDLVVTLGDGWGSNPRDLDIADAEGEAFVAQVHEGGRADRVFGDGFATYGTEQGTGTLTDTFGTYQVSDTSVVLATDDGAVEAFPGEPVEIVLDGARWRVVVHAAFQVTSYPDEMPGCGGGVSDTLSLEMLRIATEPALEPLGPMEGARLAGEYSCE